MAYSKFCYVGPVCNLSNLITWLLCVLEVQLSTFTRKGKITQMITDCISGFTLSVWLSSFNSHLGHSHFWWHHRGISRTAHQGLYNSFCSTACEPRPCKASGQQNWGSPSVLSQLPAATDQDEEVEPQVDDGRERMLWDEDGPYWVHEWSGLLDKCVTMVTTLRPKLRLTLHDLWPPEGWIFPLGKDFMLELY